MSRAAAHDPDAEAFVTSDVWDFLGVERSQAFVPLLGTGSPLALRAERQRLSRFHVLPFTPTQVVSHRELAAQ